MQRLKKTKNPSNIHTYTYFVHTQCGTTATVTTKEEMFVKKKIFFFISFSLILCMHLGECIWFDVSQQTHAYTFVWCVALSLRKKKTVSIARINNLKLCTLDCDLFAQFYHIQQWKKRRKKNPPFSFLIGSTLKLHNIRLWIIFLIPLCTSPQTLKCNMQQQNVIFFSFFMSSKDVSKLMGMIHIFETRRPITVPKSKWRHRWKKFN